MPLVTAKGRHIWVRAFGEVEHENGQAVRLVGALQDITESQQRKAELERERSLRAELERHTRELDALLRERSEMLDVMAHEVRQPLNNASAALQGAAAVLADVREPKASSRLMLAQTVLGQVLANIDNTLAVASLLARPEPIEHGDGDIDTLIAVTVADLPAGERARIRIDRATATRTASMDMNLMRLALRNLLSNAVKYSPAGSPVTVTLSDSDEPLALVIDVTDVGPGLEPDLVPRLFERGARGKAPGAPGGHGLGLYIVQRVMELHGGAVEVVSSSSVGVTMRLLVTQPPDD
jgi:signal transduction histidine kinase